MRNAPVKITAWTKTDYSISNPLTKEELRFCELVLDGVPYHRAVSESGLMPADTPKSKLNYKASYLMKTVRVQRYLGEHRKTIRVLVEKDYDILRTHMYEIAMGTASRTSERMNKDGEVVTVTESPSFRDQIAAAAWLRQDLNDRKEQAFTSQKDIVITDVKEIDQKASEFVAKYSYRPIDTRSDMKIRAIEATVGEMPDISDERLKGNPSSKEIEEAMENVFSDYRIHG